MEPGRAWKEHRVSHHEKGMKKDDKKAASTKKGAAKK